MTVDNPALSGGKKSNPPEAEQKHGHLQSNAPTLYVGGYTAPVSHLLQQRWKGVAEAAHLMP